MTMSKCRFCESLEYLKRNAERCNQIEPDPDCEFEYRYSAAIVERVFAKGDDNCRSTWTDRGYHHHHPNGYPLNFCPECGRELPKNSAIDSAGECH